MPEEPVASSEIVRAVVFSELKNIFGRAMPSLTVDDELARYANSDDLSFEFIPRVEAALGIKIPPDEWGKVGTIREICEMLGRYCREARDT